MVKFTSKPKRTELGFSVQSDKLKGSEIQMREEQKTKEKTCAFYASDYHFEMISLPYIYKNIEENKKIIILTENWKEDNITKIEKIKECSKNNKEAVIFIKGKQNYIKNMKNNIEEWIKENNEIKTIYCYDMDEVSENMSNIMDQYEAVLTTSGEKEINKI